MTTGELKEYGINGETVRFVLTIGSLLGMFYVVSSDYQRQTFRIENLEKEQAALTAKFEELTTELKTANSRVAELNWSIRELMIRLKKDETQRSALDTN